MSDRVKISSNGKFECVVGYSRAVKIGNWVLVSGTTGTGKDGELVSLNDSYEQAKQAIRNIGAALNEAGANLQDIVRTRVFVSPKASWKDVARAHLEAFGDIMPASTMLVSDFLDSKILVEIEADAIIAK